MNHTPQPPQAHEREPTSSSAKPTKSTERLALTLDLETYLGQLEDWNIPDTQKAEFIKTFWELLLSIAQIGFEIHPAQLAQQQGRKKALKTNKNKGKPAEKAGFPSPDLLYSKPYNRTQTIDASAAIQAADVSDSETKGARP